MMTTARQKILLDGQSHVARKVFEAVPIQEAWTPHMIGQALGRVTGSPVDPHVLRGCLNSLRDTGLVREAERGLFRRAEVRDSKPAPKEIQEMPKATASSPVPAPAVAIAPEAQPSAIDLLSGIATRLVAFADRAAREAKALAAEIEAAALSIEESGQADARDLEKLKQFRELFKAL